MSSFKSPSNIFRLQSTPEKVVARCSKDKDIGKDEDTNLDDIRTYKTLIAIKTEASWPMSHIEGKVGSTGFNWVQLATPIFVSVII